MWSPFSMQVLKPRPQRALYHRLPENTDTMGNDTEQEIQDEKPDWKDVFRIGAFDGAVKGRQKWWGGRET